MGESYDFTATKICVRLLAITSLINIAFPGPNKFSSNLTYSQTLNIHNVKFKHVGCIHYLKSCSIFSRKPDNMNDIHMISKYAKCNYST